MLKTSPAYREINALLKEGVSPDKMLLLCANDYHVSSVGNLPDDMQIIAPLTLDDTSKFLFKALKNEADKNKKHT